jgi:recombination protein RecA
MHPPWNEVAVERDGAARLQRVIAAVQQRWGAHALRLLGQSPAEAIPVISSGFTDLDTALGIGGFPRGRLTELLGRATSGKTTIALRALAQAQALGDRVGYLDLPATFDPEYAAWCGVDLATLLLIRPQTDTYALDLLPPLVASGGLGMLVVDDLASFQETTQGSVLLERALRVLAARLAASPCALLALTTLPHRPGVMGTIGFRGAALAYAAAIQLHVAREAWLDDGSAPPGCQVRVHVLKHKLAAPGKAARVTIAFEDHWSIV